MAAPPPREEASASVWSGLCQVEGSGSAASSWKGGGSAAYSWDLPGIQQSDIPLHRLRRWATARDRGEQTLIPLQGILNTVVRRTGFFPSAAVGGITPPPLTGEYYRLLRLQSSTFRITGGGGGSATSSSGREATLPGIMGGGSAASSWGSSASRIYEGVAAPPPRGRGVAAPTPRGEAVLPGITEGVAAPPPRGNYGGVGALPFRLELRKRGQRHLLAPSTRSGALGRGGLENAAIYT